MLTVLLYHHKGNGAAATVQTFQLAMEHIQYVFNADKTRITAGSWRRGLSSARPSACRRTV